MGVGTSGGEGIQGTCSIENCIAPCPLDGRTASEHGIG
jgi:hypothetical protein